MTEPTLIDFLRARLDEHEKRIAELRAKTGEDLGLGGPWAPDGADPVLADLAAKRQIIKLHLPKDNFPTECRTCTWNDPWEGFFSLDMPCPTLRLLALPFASHPDYRPEWAPEEMWWHS